MESLEQAILMRLQTQIGDYLIYTCEYGSELSLLVGASNSQAIANISDMLKSSLLLDDRISDVENIAVSFGDDVANIMATIVTDFGQLNVGVNINV